jgi:hypothetical protein
MVAGGLLSRSDSIMQILLGLSGFGDVQHMEILAALPPLQMLSLAKARLAEFTRVEIWEETVCVLRLPPSRPPQAARAGET